MPRLVAVSAELLDPAHPLHPASTGEPACKGFAWIDLIGRARPMDGPSLHRGELRASVRFLAARWNWSDKKVYTFLTRLEQEKRVIWTRPPVGKRVGGVICICNYDTYQPPELTGGNTFVPVTEGKRESVEPVTISPVERSRLETKGVTTLSTTGTQEEVPIGPSSLVPSVVRVGENLQNDGQISFVEPVQKLYTPNDIASMMIFRWIEQVCPAKPPAAQIKKQFRIAVLLANEYEPLEIVRAWDGMAHTYPYDKGEVWDMFDLRKHFGKAYQNASTELNEDVRWEAFFGKEEP